MRFIHLADLHFGKSIYGVSLTDRGDQAHWVDRFLECVAEKRPDAIVIAGDVYDRSAPSGEAMQLMSRMLTALSEMGIPVMMSAGNHDSAQRLAFLNQLLSRQALHISDVLCAPGELRHVTLTCDEHGPVTFWLMPYVFPALIADALGEPGFPGYDAAVRALLARQPLDPAHRNVLIAHQNVTANGAEAAHGGSETMIGGVGQVEYTAFDAFDYVALGHIHAAGAVGRDAVRYAGSPMCYHFNETRQPPKGPLLVELGAKGTDISTRVLEIAPLHPMRELRGSLDEVRARALDSAARGEYVRIVLTDCRVRPDISDFFRSLYEARDSVLMEIVSEYSETRANAGAPSAQAMAEKPVETLFEDFWRERMRDAPDDQTLELLRAAGEILRHADPDQPIAQTAVDALLRAACQTTGKEASR